MCIRDRYKGHGLGGGVHIHHQIGAAVRVRLDAALAVGAEAAPAQGRCRSFCRYGVPGGDHAAQGPVSYTHLDVYKRQVRDSALALSIIPAAPESRRPGRK